MNSVKKQEHLIPVYRSPGNDGKIIHFFMGVLPPHPCLTTQILLVVLFDYWGFHNRSLKIIGQGTSIDNQL